jgi:ER lumen protein retaining receptor
MKLFFIGSSIYVWYLIRIKYFATYDEKHDQTFAGYKILILIVPCLLIGLIFGDRGEDNELVPFEIIWTASLFLESVAIMPQLFMLTSKGESDTLTIHYIVALVFI